MFDDGCVAVTLLTRVRILKLWMHYNQHLWNLTDNALKTFCKCMWSINGSQQSIGRKWVIVRPFLLLLLHILVSSFWCCFNVPISHHIDIPSYILIFLLDVIYVPHSYNRFTFQQSFCHFYSSLSYIHQPTIACLSSPLFIL